MLSFTCFTKSSRLRKLEVLLVFRELAFFFPEYQVPQVAKPGSRAHPSRVAQRGVQRTLALIRPDALVDKKGENACNSSVNMTDVLGIGS